MRDRGLFSFLTSICLIVFAARAAAQTGASGIAGVAKDTSGAPCCPASPSKLPVRL